MPVSNGPKAAPGRQKHVSNKVDNHTVGHYFHFIICFVLFRHHGHTVSRAASQHYQFLCSMSTSWFCYIVQKSIKIDSYLSKTHSIVCTERQPHVKPLLWTFCTFLAITSTKIITDPISQSLHLLHLVTREPRLHRGNSDYIILELGRCIKIFVINRRYRYYRYHISVLNIVFFDISILYQ